MLVEVATTLFEIIPCRGFSGFKFLMKAEHFIERLSSKGARRASDSASLYSIPGQIIRNALF